MLNPLASAKRLSLDSRVYLCGKLKRLIVGLALRLVLFSQALLLAKDERWVVQD
jgi:hypothetical protein